MIVPCLTEIVTTKNLFYVTWCVRHVTAEISGCQWLLYIYKSQGDVVWHAVGQRAGVAVPSAIVSVADDLKTLLDIYPMYRAEDQSGQFRRQHW